MINVFTTTYNHGGVTQSSYITDRDAFYGTNDNLAQTYVNESMQILSQSTLSQEERIFFSESFRYLAEYYGSQGVVKCLDSLREGWYILKKGILYSYWANKISIRIRDFWDEDSRNRVGFLGEISDLKTILGVGFILASVETFELFDLVIKHIDTQYISWNNDDFYPEYLVRLYSMLQKKPEWKNPITRPRRWWKHPYRNIFDHWNDGTNLARDITAMLNYHVQWNCGFSRDHRSEFHSHFTMINPFELHVLEHVREQLGLTTPKVDHVLTNSPFYPLPNFVKNISSNEIYEEDDLLRKFVERNRDWCNGLDNNCEQNDIEMTYAKGSNNLFVSQNEDSKHELSCEKSRLRAYIFSMDKFREYFGSGDLSIIEKLNIPSYLKAGNIDFKRGLIRFLEGHDADPNKPIEECISAWEIVCNHVGQSAKIDEFTNIGVIPVALFESFMLSIEIFPDIDNTFAFFADYEMIQSIVESISIRPMNNSLEENEDDTGLGIGLSFQLSGLIQSIQETNTNNQYSNQNLQNVVVGLTSLLIQAYRQKKDIIIFFDQNNL
ncbi:MAG: hypothetical protein LBP59_00690 [Planctomycetaceae bacterium]|jgi:hypothetical protein|nr:hypothetical protein [Planctomycetaceae bacterium]